MVILEDSEKIPSISPCTKKSPVQVGRPGEFADHEEDKVDAMGRNHVLILVLVLRKSTV